MANLLSNHRLGLQGETSLQKGFAYGISNRTKTSAKMGRGKRLLPQTSLTRTDDRLGAVGDLQFAEDA